MSLEDLEKINSHLEGLRHDRERTLKTLDAERIPKDLAYIDEAIDSDVNFEPICEVGDINELFEVAANLAAFIRQNFPEEFPRAK